MYLKINWDNKTKKVTFKEEWRSLGLLRAFLAALTGLPEPELKVSFKDSDDEDVVLTDEADLGYFLSDTKDKQFAVLKVERRVLIETTDSTTFDPNVARDSEVAFKNVTTDFSGTFPLDPFHVDQSEIRLSTQDPVDERGGCFLPSLLPQPRPSENQGSPSTAGQYKGSPKQVLEDSPKKEEAKLPIPALPTNVVEPKPKKEKPISEPKIILQKPKEPEPPAPADPEVLLETSAFGMSVLDRLCALEKKMDYMGVSKAHQLLPPAPEPQTLIQTRHLAIKCSSCHVRPIVGKRFYCLVCLDCNWCEDCEAADPHPHPSVRVITRQDDDVLRKLQKKFEKINSKSSRSLGEKISDVVNIFRKPAPQPPATPPPTPAQLLQMIEFMDEGKQLSPEVVLRKYGGLSLEDFCQKVQWELQQVRTR